MVIERSTKKEIVENICKEIEASKNTHIWSDYVNALKLISQVIFTRSSGFILELIQNAEDSGLGLTNQGVFEVSINKQRVKIVHNGKPFNESDIKALCGIRSSKKPERGTLGYLGIGFKSVFKVTDRPEIYSNGFQFKFDRNHWDEPGKTPWQVIPLWIDKSLETIDTEKTTFIIPYREEEYYPVLLEEIEKIRTELYFFLKWLKKIVIIDEVSGRTSVLENIGETEDDVTILKHDDKQQRFKFFRRTLEQIPDEVKQDRLTQEYRANVTKREIAIGFALNTNGSLDPSEAGAMYGGVYSFLPLGEARSGAKFPIQADFLVQPGRDAINYEAKWNQWLLKEVANICKEAIEYFKKHDKWKYQFLPMFEFERHEGLESYDKLFRPKLIDPLEKFLEENDCVPTMDGGWIKPIKAVRILENQEAIKDLINMDIFKSDEVASIMGAQAGSKLVHPDVIDRKSKLIKEANRWDILKNDDFMKSKIQTSRAANWFRSFYLWLQKYPDYETYYHYGWRKKVKTYHECEFILTSDGRILKGGEVSFLDISLSDPIVKKLSEELQKSKPLLHPEILAGANEEEQETIKGFLTGLTGVQVLNTKNICKEGLLPKIQTNAPKPSAEELLKYTNYCQQILGEEITAGLEFWVLTKQNEIKSAKETFFSKEFKPKKDWETYQQYLPGISFINPKYILNLNDDVQLEAWRRFFEKGGVKDDPDNGVEEFAMNYAEQKLKAKCRTVTRVEEMNFGYDIEAENQNGKKIYIEVKGKGIESDVELTNNETRAADKYKDVFYLCVISPIPERPIMYMVLNPASPEIGEKDKLTIPVNAWKIAKWLF